MASRLFRFGFQTQSRPLFTFGARSFAGIERRGISTSSVKDTSSLGAMLFAGVAGGIALYQLCRDNENSVEAEEKKKNVALDPNEFKSFKLQEVRKVNHNTSTFRFALESKDQVLGLPVASCIVTKAPLGDKPVIRPYTPVSSDDEKGYFDLMVKEYPQGVMSKHIHSLKVGDSLEVKGPIPKLAYQPNMKKSIGMLAGGTGVAPMYQVIKEILKNPNDKTDVTLVFANIAEEDILLRKEFDDLAKKHKNFHVHYVLEKAPKGWTGPTGFISEDLIKKVMPKPSDDSLICVCGPPGMMDALSGNKAKDFTQGPLSGALKKLGYAEKHVYKF